MRQNIWIGEVFKAAFLQGVATISQVLCQDIPLQVDEASAVKQHVETISHISREVQKAETLPVQEQLEACRVSIAFISELGDCIDQIGSSAVFPISRRLLLKV